MRSLKCMVVCYADGTKVLAEIAKELVGELISVKVPLLLRL